MSSAEPRSGPAPASEEVLQVTSLELFFDLVFVFAVTQLTGVLVQELSPLGLESTSRPVGTVASDVGYDDVVAFRKLFARGTGLTPSDYRGHYGPRTAPELVLGRGRAPARSNSLAGARQ